MTRPGERRVSVQFSVRPPTVPHSPTTTWPTPVHRGQERRRGSRSRAVCAWSRRSTVSQKSVDNPFTFFFFGRREIVSRNAARRRSDDAVTRSPRPTLLLPARDANYVRSERSGGGRLLKSQTFVRASDEHRRLECRPGTFVERFRD